jgi:hypothetical protein
MSLRLGLCLIAALCLLSGCSSTSDNSLLSSEALASATAIDKTPNANDLAIRVNSSVVIASNGKVEVSGDCFTSTYPSHNIMISNGSSVLTSVIDVANPSNGNRYGTCVNGKYTIALDSSTYTAGARLTVTLYVYDSSNTAACVSNGVGTARCPAVTFTAN